MQKTHKGAIKREITLILALVIIVILLIALITFLTVDVEQADAKRFVMEDLSTQFQNADIEILSTVEKYTDKNEKYFEVKAKITKNIRGTCPERIHRYYNYPEQNFVPQPDEQITTGCVVCKEKPCIIAFPEEAIIASHTLPGSEEVKDFIGDQASVVPEVKETSNSWIVLWDSALSRFLYQIEISKNGTVISKQKVDKQI